MPATLTLTLTAAVSKKLKAFDDLVLEQGPLPPAVVGTPYSYRLVAAGGATPYAWTLKAGTLAPGLTLAADGLISGTPAAAFDGTPEFECSCVVSVEG